MDREIGVIQVKEDYVYLAARDIEIELGGEPEVVVLLSRQEVVGRVVEVQELPDRVGPVEIDLIVIRQACQVTGAIVGIGIREP